MGWGWEGGCACWVCVCDDGGMCGIFGCVAAGDRGRSVGDGLAVRLRDVLEHRGPDDAGLWGDRHAVFAHRRLSVIEPGPAGHQPMLADDEGGVWCSGVDAERDRGARYVLVYNGELYNDLQVRRGLEAKGVRCDSRCDTETVLRALVRWGVRAIGEFRGMFALGFYDVRERKLVLARDPLGVKPLYFHADAGEVVFGSEVGAVLGAPGVSVRPNAAMISAYVTTIRTVIGSSTLYEGVLSVRPGEVIEASLGGGDVEATAGRYWEGPKEITEPISMGVASEWVRKGVEESVRAHLRSDVPTCALLSGGLDSTITSGIARGAVDGLRTYAAGAVEGDEDGVGGSGDLEFAREVASAFGTRHSEAIVDGEIFDRVWGEMVGRMRMPMSTPNEVAIFGVASRLRADGCVVTVSGEGADELFGGYGLPLMRAHGFVEGGGGGGEGGPGRFAVESSAWASLAIKGQLMEAGVWAGLGEDVALVEAYEAEYWAAVEECGLEGVPAFLRLQRRINLTGLLQRLDTATMLAGVEGRTPFADARVARLAEALPLGLKFVAGEGDEAAGTKVVLREAFRDAVPARVVDRPKASFPLPFRKWMGARAAGLRESGFARAVFSAEAIELVSRDPGEAWGLAWPMLNVAMWGDGVWGAAS